MTKLKKIYLLAVIFFFCSTAVYAAINIQPNGGTGTGTIFTQGSVVFQGSSSNYTQDNNFFWDNTTKGIILGDRSLIPITPNYNTAKNINVLTDINTSKGFDFHNIDPQGRVEFGLQAGSASTGSAFYLLAGGESDSLAPGNFDIFNANSQWDGSDFVLDSLDNFYFNPNGGGTNGADWKFQIGDIQSGTNLVTMGSNATNILDGSGNGYTILSLSPTITQDTNDTGIFSAVSQNFVVGGSGNIGQINGNYSNFDYNGSGNIELIVGDFETPEVDSGTIGELSGFVGTPFAFGGSITNEIGGAFSVAISGATVANAYGVRVSNISGATNNWAIKTGTGKVEFGDSTQIDTLTASRAVATDSNKILVSSATTSTELGYLSGVTSAIQTQLNTKGSGTVTSVSGSGGTTGLTLTGGAITTSGTLTLGGTLALANGGTGSSTALGIPVIVGNDRKTGLTASQALATLTVPASDTTYQISMNVNITAVAVASFTEICTYTDETNTSRALTLNFSQVNGTLVQTLTAALGAGAYEGVPLEIRAKASTTVICGSASGGTYTSVTYNEQERILQE